MWKLESSKVRPLSRALAETFMKMEPAPNDRELSERRIRVYRQAVAEGMFRPCTWAQAFCEETGITYRANGKHTSKLFAELESIPPDMYVTVETYTCPTLSDVARLYGTFDASISSRTASDINRSFAATVPELAKLPRRTIDATAAGIQLYRSGGVMATAQQVRPTVRAEHLLTEAPFVLWVASIVTDTNKFRHLSRAGVIAAMFANYKKSQKDAYVFWTAVRDETGTSPHNPDRVLAKWLSMTSVHSSYGGELPRSRRAEAREFFVKSLHAWNAWRRNAPLKQLNYKSETKIPAVV